MSFKNSCRYTMDAIGDLLAGLDIPSWIPSDSRQCTIDFYKPGYYRGLERCHMVVPEVQNLISKEDIPHFSCDITDIQGIPHRNLRCMILVTFMNFLY